MDWNKEVILALISERPLSSHQIATELGIDSNDNRSIRKLWELLDDLREAKLVDIAIDRKAPTAYEGALIGPNTFRYYRRDEVKELERKGILSETREVRIGVDIREIARSEGFLDFIRLRRRERLG